MKKNPHNPHDVFMKALLADSTRARTFLEQLLPAELTNQLDLDTLQPEDRSFVRGDLRGFFSDANHLLFE